LGRRRIRTRILFSVLLAGSLFLNFSGTASAQSLRPSPSQAPNDLERLFHDGCLGYEPDTTPPRCVYGDKNGAYTMALVGDSHTSMLFPAFEKIAKDHHWRLIPLVKINCPFIDMKIKSAHFHTYYPACETWNAKVVKRLKNLKPDLVVTIIFKGIFPMRASDDTPEKTGAAVGRMLARVPGQKIVMVDTPYANWNIPNCVSSKPASQCAIPRRQVMSDGVVKREEAAANEAAGTVLDMTSQICGGFPCRVVTGDILMFRDNHHFTATYARYLGPVIYTSLQPLLE
jgi:hypothetical protein